jgi:hypothetical protein
VKKAKDSLASLSVAKHVYDDLQQAAIQMEKLATKG